MIPTVILASAILNIGGKISVYSCGSPHGQRAVKCLGQFVHGVVLVAIDRDGIGKKATKQQRVYGEKPNDHRWNGQQNQGQGDHPRRLMGGG